MQQNVEMKEQTSKWVWDFLFWFGQAYDIFGTYMGLHVGQYEVNPLLASYGPYWVLVKLGLATVFYLVYRLALKHNSKFVPLMRAVIIGLIIFGMLNLWQGSFFTMVRGGLGT